MVTGLGTMAVLPNLPDYFRPGSGGALPAGIVGSTIRGIGTIDGAGGVEGGGLVIEYVPPGAATPRRVVFGFNELALWVEYLGGVPPLRA